ncbi:MAG: L-lactate dehydrogenase [Acidimicrobiales bacterium]
MRGLRADRPLGLAPATVSDYRELARRRLPRQLFDYIDGGANSETTMAANVASFEAIGLRQRVLRDVSHCDLSVDVLGQHLELPVILAPVGLGGMYAKRAEVQAARAAEAAGTVFVESTVSVCGLEEVRDATERPIWFQLYVMRDRRYAEGLMARATACETPVLILTVDLPVVGARYRDLQNGLVGELEPLAKIRRGIDLASHPQWLRNVAIGGKPHTFGNLEDAVPGARTPAQFRNWVDTQFDPSVTWDDLAWVREHWNAKLVLKGILDPDDARIAIDHGVDGIVVSNHGGRQLDGVPATVDVLASIVAAVDGRADVLVDGGIRNGLDVAKAIALGAKAVMVGRPWAWAVAAKGQRGVEHVLATMRADLTVALGLTGVNAVADLDPTCLIPPGGHP